MGFMEEASRRPAVRASLTQPPTDSEPARHARFDRDPLTDDQGSDARAGPGARSAGFMAQHERLVDDITSLTVDVCLRSNEHH